MRCIMPTMITNDEKIGHAKRDSEKIVFKVLKQ